MFIEDKIKAGEATNLVIDLVAATNELDNAEFISLMFTIMNTRFDFRFNFGALAGLTTHLLCNAGIDMDDIGNNLAGLISNEENTN